MPTNKTLASTSVDQEWSDVPWLLGSGWRPIILLLLALALPTALFTWGIVEEVRHSLDEQAAHFNHATAQLAGRVVQERFQGSAHYVESFAGRTALRRAMASGNTVAQTNQLRDLVEGNPSIDRALLTTPDGRLVSVYPAQARMQGTDLSFRDWFQGIRRTKRTYVSGLYLRLASPQRYTVAIATPIQGAAQGTVGYLVGQHTVETLATWLNSLTPSDHGHVLLADPNGQLALAPDGPTSPLKRLDGHRLGERLARGQQGALRAMDPLSSRPSLIETAAATSGWSVVVSQPLSDTHVLLRTLQQTTASLALVFASGVATLGLFWLRTIRRYQGERLAAARELKQRAEALEAANEELRKSERYKDEFLSVVSHELRTPLNGVTGFASILEDEVCGPLNPDQHQQVQQILKSGDRMLVLVNNLLEMSRIQAGAFTLSPSWVPIGAVAYAVQEAMRVRATDAGIRLEAQVETDQERCLDGDRLRLVLMNLVDNALKFTPAGGKVRIRVSVVDDALRCEVSDSGVGLHPTDVERIFDRFRQADMSATRQAGGTGLGLAIAKAIVEAHGGRIGVKSAPGRGATFWFSIPAMAGCAEG